MVSISATGLSPMRVLSRQGNSSEGLRVATYLGMASSTYSAVRFIGGAIAAIAAGDA